MLGILFVPRMVNVCLIFVRGWCLCCSFHTVYHTVAILFAVVIFFNVLFSVLLVCVTAREGAAVRRAEVWRGQGVPQQGHLHHGRRHRRHHGTREGMLLHFSVCVFFSIVCAVCATEVCKFLRSILFGAYAGAFSASDIRLDTRNTLMYIYSEWS